MGALRPFLWTVRLTGNRTLPVVLLKKSTIILYRFFSESKETLL